MRKRNSPSGGARSAAGVEPASWLPPIPRRSLLAFAALIVLLLGPWPGTGRVFGTLFSGYANGVVRVLHLGDGWAPRFVPEPSAAKDEGGEWTVGLSETPLDTRILGYTPLAVFLALTLASSVAVRRKLVMLGIGLTLLLARLAVAIALPVSRALSGPTAGAPVGTLSEVIWWVFIDQPAMSYAAPMLAWWIALTVTTAPTMASPKSSPIRFHFRSGNARSPGVTGRQRRQAGDAGRAQPSRRRRPVV